MKDDGPVTEEKSSKRSKSRLNGYAEDDGQRTVPAPVKVKVESGNRESLLPLPIKVKKEKHKSRDVGQEVWLPVPLTFKEEAEINVKVEKRRHSFVTSSRNCSFNDDASSTSDARLPSPIKVKFEKRHQASSAEEQALVPAPKRIKVEVNDLNSSLVAKPKKKKKSRKAKEDDGDEFEVVQRDWEEKVESRKKHKGIESHSAEEEALVPAPKRTKVEINNVDSSLGATPRKKKKPKKTKEDDGEELEEPRRESDSESEEIVLPQPVESNEELFNNSRDLTAASSVAPSKPDPNNWHAALMTKYPGAVEYNLDVTVPERGSVEYFMLRCPKTIDPQSLVGATWDLGSREGLKFKVPGRKGKYNLRVLSGKSERAVFRDSAVKNVSVRRLLSIEKYLKDSGTCEIPTPEQTSILLPENLKERHPLFGPVYKKQIKLDERIRKRLREAESNLRRINKKLLKKRPKTKIPDDEDDSIRNIFDAVEPAKSDIGNIQFSPAKKKSKKHKTQ
ncbi:uncharacterized protein LOC132707856 [Cylas formicarius]|uniref:uncharacterized protein LOC132707856 n=1 Tax=Cylas formicarius TaxID=197179 RepID=UPI002958CF9B|nr:uncharacterized protein LOC132707856 [Cylas formicarius]